MEPTSTDKKVSQVSQWFHMHPQVGAKKNAFVKNPDSVAFVNYLWPASLDYECPLTPVYLCELTSLKIFNSNQRWMVRDGLIPLLWFFRTYSEPKGLKSKIFVAEQFAGVVPPRWRKFCGTYRVISNVVVSGKPRQRLLLTSIVMDTFCSIDHLEKQLKDLLKRFGKENLAKLDIRGFLPSRYDGFQNEFRPCYPMEFAFKISEYLGTNIKSISWDQFESMVSLIDTKILDLNENLLIADNFILHRAMTKGAENITGDHSRNEIKKGESFFALSPHHGLALSEKVKTPFYAEKQEQVTEDQNRFYKMIEYALRSEAHRRLPWPRWFTQWTRSQGV